MKKSVFVVAGASLALTVLSLGARPAGAKVVGPPEVAWKDMTYAQKKAYMKTAVTPKMKEVFQAFDGETFKTFNCETCHGKGAADRKFKMPSPDIKPLPDTPEAFQAKLKAEKTWPKWTDFMVHQVEPSMGKLLDMPVFDPKKPDPNAFGCNRCHKLEHEKT
ncbi:MAG TPA: hypothetical protein VHJ20_04660 [Polyangia bacterium]|nr:hypothetical protein [Polyangia bacterium]